MYYNREEQGFAIKYLPFLLKFPLLFSKSRFIFSSRLQPGITVLHAFSFLHKLPLNSFFYNKIILSRISRP